MNMVQFLASDNAVVAAALRISMAAREPVGDLQPIVLRRMSGLSGYLWREHGEAATEWAGRIQEAGGLGRLAA